MERFCFSGGEWTSDGEIFEVRSPWDGSLAGMAVRPAPRTVEESLERARGIFPALRCMPAHEKASLLRRCADGISQRKDEFTNLITLESGKPARYSSGEVARAVQTFTEAAEEASRLYGEVIPLDVAPRLDGTVGITGLFPVGPVLAITPFNFPLNLVAHKVAPALAAGCPVILKPSSETPLTALLLAAVLEEAGVPAGALSVLPMTGPQAGDLAGRDGIAAVTFTGSAAVGWELKRAAWKKRVTLELGGNAAVAVHEDWEDIDDAASRICSGGYAYSGQVCISVQRIFVHRPVFDRFMDRYIEAVEGLRYGDPLDGSTEIGPMITEKEARRVEGWIEEAVAAGATLRAGGRRDGAFVPPAVLTGARKGMKVVDEEIFGPVTAVFPYDDFSRALEGMNDSRYGLQAGLFTRDIGRIREAYSRLEVGAVIAGDVPTFRVDRMPYGGAKESGTGREGLRSAIREMCEPRLLVLR